MLPHQLRPSVCASSFSPRRISFLRSSHTPSWNRPPFVSGIGHLHPTLIFRCSFGSQLARTVVWQHRGRNRAVQYRRSEHNHPSRCLLPHKTKTTLLLLLHNLLLHARLLAIVYSLTLVQATYRPSTGRPRASPPRIPLPQQTRLIHKPYQHLPTNARSSPSPKSTKCAKTTQPQPSFAHLLLRLALLRPPIPHLSVLLPYPV